MDFFYSPGFGGAAAVLAAGVAFVVAELRRRTDKQEKKLDRAAEAQQRRWDRFTFILEHQAELGATVVLAALVRLSEEAAAAADPSLSALVDDFTLALITDVDDQAPARVPPASAARHEQPGVLGRVWRTMSTRYRPGGHGGPGR